MIRTMILEIKILGKQTLVHCPQGQEEALLAAANQLNNHLQNMVEKTKINDKEQLLITAALNAIYEKQAAVQALAEHEANASELYQQIEKLTGQLTLVLQ